MAWGWVEIAHSWLEMRTRDSRPPTFVKYIKCRWQNLSFVYLAEQLNAPIRFPFLYCLLLFPSPEVKQPLISSCSLERLLSTHISSVA